MSRTSKSSIPAVVLLAYLAGCAVQPTRAGREMLQAAAPAASLTPAETDLTELTATAAVALLCSRNVTTVAYVQALLDRLDAGWSCINSFQTLNRTKLMADAAAIDAKAASGQSIKPLCGLPLAVKDSIDVLGYPTTASTPALLNAYPTSSAPLINSYLAANGIIMGKAALDELQDGGNSVNPTNQYEYGLITTMLNAYNQTRIAGGSSGGSGNSVGGRIAPLALCEDTGGSCRMPASANGIYGFRPSLGCYNFTTGMGLVPAEFTRDTVGSMAREIDDLILLDSIVRMPNITTTGHGMIPEPVSCAAPITNINLNGTRIGLPSTFGWATGLSGEIVAAVNATMNALKAAGVVFVPFDSGDFTDAANIAWAGVPESDNYMEPEATARYLWLHNYNLTVTEVFAAINRPDLRTQMMASLQLNANTAAGDFDAFVEFLQYGRPAIGAQWALAYKAHNVSAFLYPVFAISPREVDGYNPYVEFQNGTFIPAQSAKFCSQDAQATQTSMLTDLLLLQLPSLLLVADVCELQHDRNRAVELDAISAHRIHMFLAFPTGQFSTDGLPVGMQFSGPPGADGLLLSLAKAVSQVLPTLPAPASPPGCTGCTANVAFNPATFTQVGNSIPTSNQTYTNFHLTFNGTCNSPSLTSYGQNGVFGIGSHGFSNGLTTVAI
ncbi:hypothetical protein WJX82_009095 [Trebouxia sp. C0006]